jgi:phosphoglycolate phosphatase
VLFDLDGTLLDTIEDLGTSMNAVLFSHGFPLHPIDSFRFFVGDGVETLVTRAIPESRRGDGGLLALCVDEMRMEYGKRWKEKTRPYPGITRLLDRLSDFGVIQAVLSNKPHEFVVKMLMHYFPGTEFRAVLGRRPEFPKKPNPASALEISRIAGVPPGGFLYLGDTNTDMLTAKAAGMFPIGALWGFRTEGELREAGAERVVGHPMDLISLLDPPAVNESPVRKKSAPKPKRFRGA